jgi:hypothetical protein
MRTKRTKAIEPSTACAGTPENKLMGFRGSFPGPAVVAGWSNCRFSLDESCPLCSTAGRRSAQRENGQLT